MIELVFMAAAVGGSLYFFKAILGGTVGMDWLFSLLPKGIGKLFGDEKTSGARFLSGREQSQYLNQRNEGLILDGLGKKRLSLKDSFQHVAVISPTGAGKTTRYIAPNLCGLDDCSTIVTDPSGELYEKTSGYMESKGFEVQVLNLADPSHGLCYNPVAKANTETEIDKLSQLIMNSSKSEISAENQIWTSEPQTLLSVLIRCLKNTGEPEWMNLPNVLRLLQNFTQEGDNPIDDFVRKYSPYDGEATMDQYMGFRNSNSKMLSSFLTMARNSLQIVKNREVAGMLSYDEIDFHKLREQKTVLYLITPETDTELYAFILNSFYTQLFEFQKQQRYMSEDFLPLHVLYDEFGHSKIAGFDTVATTIRKYRVSLSIILQDFGQLEKQYGKEAARTILSGGMRTKLFYAGLDIHTAEMVEKMLGKVVVERKNGSHKDVRIKNLMNADRISRMDADEAIGVTSNKEPFVIHTTPSYRHPHLKRVMQMPPVPFPKPLPMGNIKHVPL